MKPLKKFRRKPIPIVFVEGGVVQDVFLPMAKGSKSIEYDLVDVDIFDGDDQEIADKWESLEPDTRQYFMVHSLDVYGKFREAFERLAHEKNRRERLFVAGTARPWNDIKWGQWVLRRNKTTGRIETLRLYTALDEIADIDALADPKNQFQTRHDIVTVLSRGRTVTVGGCEYILDDREN